uniref:PDZ domain-containing protein n=1 Tax=Trichuris muris TaxID=70415 RepID=A0A5S6QJ74_TRIMR
MAASTPGGGKRPLIVLKIDLSKPAKSFGLGIRMHNGKVMVSSMKPNSISSDHFKVGDFIVSIDKQPVPTKMACRNLITSNKGILEVIVEREIELKLTHESYVQGPVIVPAPGSEKPSAEEKFDPAQWKGLPADIQDILIKQFKLAKKEGIPQGGQTEIKKASESLHISLVEGVTKHEIGSDVAPGKFLRRPPPL